MRPLFFRVLFLLWAGAVCIQTPGLFAQESGEILLSPQKTPDSRREEIKKPEIPIVAKEKNAGAFLEEAPGYRKKILAVYIASGVCLLYLLITYRSRKRRI